MNLSLLQLADSALPVGGYSHSWGLEAAIDRGLVRGAEELERWADRWLRFTVSPFEGVVVAAVCRSATRQYWPAVLRANDLLHTGLTPPTLRHASQDMGEQLLALAAHWPWAEAQLAALRAAAGHTGPVREWHHAPVFATLTAAAGATPAVAVGVYLHQATLGVVGAGVRAIPVGHTHGQEIVARLHPLIGRLADDLAERALETAGSFCPAYEELCHAQSTLYSRLFRS